MQLKCASTRGSSAHCKSFYTFVSCPLAHVLIATLNCYSPVNVSLFHAFKHTHWVADGASCTFFSSTAIQPFGPCPLISLSSSYTQSVGLLVRGISPSQDRYLRTGQHKHRINTHIHPCLEWDLIRRPQCSSGRRRFMHWTARSP
jgi:hypothetical protein